MFPESKIEAFDGQFRIQPENIADSIPEIWRLFKIVLSRTGF